MSTKRPSYNRSRALSNAVVVTIGVGIAFFGARTFNPMRDYLKSPEYKLQSSNIALKAEDDIRTDFGGVPFARDHTSKKGQFKPILEEKLRQLYSQNGGSDLARRMKGDEYVSSEIYRIFSHSDNKGNPVADNETQILYFLTYKEDGDEKTTTQIMRLVRDDRNGETTWRMKDD